MTPIDGEILRLWLPSAKKPKMNIIAGPFFMGEQLFGQKDARAVKKSKTRFGFVICCDNRGYDDPSVLT